MTAALRRASKRTLVAALALAATMAGCRSNRPSPSAGDPYVLTAEQLEASRQPVLYDAIRALRPQWLRRTYTSPRDANADPAIVVYVDNQRAGGLSVLRGLSTDAVRAVRFYSPSEAQGRFGSGHLDGAIHVVTLDQGVP